MSVLSCDRRGCDNIMCDRFSYKYQAYICGDCFKELVTARPVSIRGFLQSNKCEVEDLPDLYNHYDEIFPSS